MSLAVQIVGRRRLNGTIDGHDPLVVTFRIRGSHGWFRLTVVTVNWGRGYQIDQFHDDVMRVLNRVDEREYVVILMQEIDETDLANEHGFIRAMLQKIWEKGTTLVQWATREPIAVSPGVPVTDSRKKMTMDQGTKIGAPSGVGPRRYYTSCIATIEGVRIGFGNQHPHRYSLVGRAVSRARSRGERIVRREIRRLARRADLVIDGGDLNTPRYPLSHPDQRIAYQSGLDYIRYIVTNRRKP